MLLPNLRALAAWYEPRGCNSPGGFHRLAGVLGYIRGEDLHELRGDVFEDVRLVFWFDC